MKKILIVEDNSDYREIMNLFITNMGRHLPFVGTFALAVCFGALGHFIGVDQDLLIASIARALRPGGRFVFISDTKPPILSARFWLAHGFNGAMRVRNALLRPPFVMC